MVFKLSRIIVTITLGASVCLTGWAATQRVSVTAWQQAEPGYSFTFPDDHGSHPDYRVEWWYYTGNLNSSDGRPFGYQLTFFRVGIDREPLNPSPWAIRDLHMAHLAVTDVRDERHLVAERLNRTGVGWAGASVETLNVWNEEWSVRLDGTTHVASAYDRDDQFGVDLRLEPTTPPVLHGVDGFSQKGSQVGNASQYYSLTGLRTTGRIVVDGRSIDVEGVSWMDHEFGTSFLEAGQQGWDWFSLQLDDQTELMVYVLRRRDGSIDQHSGGTLIDAAGKATVLQFGDYGLQSGRTWKSATSHAEYPVEWVIDIPSQAMFLNVRAVLDDQELHTDESTGVTYWEGAVVATGTRNGRRLQGRGYLEMTGYAGAPMSEVLR